VILSLPASSIQHRLEPFPIGRAAQRIVILLALLALSAEGGWAQEFEPRTYAVTPVGLNFVAVGYGFVTGAVFMDPALPVDDVDADIHVAFTRYTRSLNLFNRPSKLKVLLPWTSGDWSGTLEGLDAERHATGLGDARLVIETLFAGAPLVDPSGMPADARPTIWGARLQVVAPTGDYENDKLINLGSNRWAFIPEIGFAHSKGHWSFEGALGAWLFGDNDDFFNGRHLEQDPLLVAKVHAIRTIRPGYWFAVAGGYGYGAGPTSTARPGQQSSGTGGSWRCCPIPSRRPRGSA